jgi:hypothetical protein
MKAVFVAATVVFYAIAALRCYFLWVEGAWWGMRCPECTRCLRHLP